ncbi:hypothetical protein AJ88_19185 [Mesorhizobium amorphae CCBAU 01583]|nr:hypothetical protein AJ88_19185 [Mesorhizobium amorphae CCBAU 01583]
MAIESKELAVTYYPIPKSGSSSVKFALIALGWNDIDFPDPDNEVHSHLPTNHVDPFHPLRDAHKRRVHHCSRSAGAASLGLFQPDSHARVMARPSADGEKLEQFGIPVDPDLDTFILNIEKYCACSWEVRFHVASVRHFTGSNLFQFERVFRFERMDEVGAFFSALCGRALDLPRLQAAQRNSGHRTCRPKRSPRQCGSAATTMAFWSTITTQADGEAFPRRCRRSLDAACLRRSGSLA